MTHDRGAFNELIFQRCERGFILRQESHATPVLKVWAFDDIHALASWLVYQYGDEGRGKTIFEEDMKRALSAAAKDSYDASGCA